MILFIDSVAYVSSPRSGDLTECKKLINVLNCNCHIPI